MDLMNNLGSDFDGSGSVMSPEALADMRRKQGKCVTCGQQCFKKKVFKMIPLTIKGQVDDGKCLKCEGGGGVGGGMPGLASSIRPTPSGGGPAFNSAASMPPGGGSSAFSVSSSLPPGGPGGSFTPSIPSGGSFAPSASMGSYGSSHGGSSTFNAASSMPPSFGSSGGSSSTFNASASLPASLASTNLAAPSRAQSLPIPEAGLSRDGSNKSLQSGHSGKEKKKKKDKGERKERKDGERKEKKEKKNKKKDKTADPDEPVMAAVALDEPIMASVAVEPAEVPAPMPQIDDPSDDYFGYDPPPADTGASGGFGFDAPDVGHDDDGFDAPEDNYDPLLEDTDIPPHRGEETVKIVETSATGKNATSKERSLLEDAFNRLKDSKGNLEGTENALEEIALLKLTPDDTDTMIDIGVAELISETLSAHEGALNILNWGFSCIWNLSGTVKSQTAFAKSGVVEIMVSTMEKNKEDASFQENALAALCNLAAAKDNLPAMMEKNDVIGRIVDAMNTHSTFPTVLTKTCNTVANLAFHNSPFKKKIMESGVPGSLIIVMVMNPSDVDLIEAALRAMRNLTVNEPSSKQEFANNGGIDSTISAMQMHRNCIPIQREAAWVVSNLSSTIGNREVFGDCGGIDVIVRCLLVHSDDAIAVEKGLRALYNLSLDPHNVGIIIELDGARAVVQGLTSHSESSAIQEIGCATIASLARDSEDAKLIIVDEEALDALVMSMVLNSEDAGVQSQACRALHMLCHPENTQSMFAANIVELVTVAGERYPECRSSYEGIIREMDLY